jgi:hypothetical protein
MHRFLTVAFLLSAGVVELIGRLLADDLASVASRIRNHAPAPSIRQAGS